MVGHRDGYSPRCSSSKRTASTRTSGEQRFDFLLMAPSSQSVEPLQNRGESDRHAPRRSGLRGPTAIPSRSDIFKRRWCTGDVGPKGTDLRRPTISRWHDIATPSRGRAIVPVVRAFTVRRPSFRGATFSRGGGAPEMSDLKAPTYEDRSLVGRAFTVRRPIPSRGRDIWGWATFGNTIVDFFTFFIPTICWFELIGRFWALIKDWP
jgi:hypothetical protein